MSDVGYRMFEHHHVMRVTGGNQREIFYPFSHSPGCRCLQLVQHLQRNFRALSGKEGPSGQLFGSHKVLVRYKGRSCLYCATTRHRQGLREWAVDRCCDLTNWLVATCRCAGQLAGWGEGGGGHHGHLLGAAASESAACKRGDWDGGIREGGR